MIIRSNNTQLPSNKSPESWPSQAEAGANRAIAKWGLLQKGWMGFDQIPWVARLREDYPEAPSLAQSCSVHRPEFRQQASDLFAKASAEDRPLLRDYFAGKLGLEELSCRRSGAGAGMCDKRSAFQEIYQIANQACLAPAAPVVSEASNYPCLPPEGIVV